MSSINNTMLKQFWRDKKNDMIGTAPHYQDSDDKVQRLRDFTHSLRVLAPYSLCIMRLLNVHLTGLAFEEIKYFTNSISLIFTVSLWRIMNTNQQIAEEQHWNAQWIASPLRDSREDCLTRGFLNSSRLTPSESVKSYKDATCCTFLSRRESRKGLTS